MNIFYNILCNIATQIPYSCNMMTIIEVNSAGEIIWKNDNCNVWGRYLTCCPAELQLATCIDNIAVI